METILQVENLTKSYTGFRLEDITFSIPSGSIMGLIGENGAGKSTTINAVLNLIQKDTGKITFWGRELSDDPKKMKEDIGVVFDEINFYETLTPSKVEKISAASYMQWDKNMFDNYMKKFALPVNKEIKTFSKGMKVKLCIAAALSHHPKLLILDEATSGLDPIMRDEILDEFLDFVQDESHSILISSHITSDLEKVADYITFIHQGHIIYSDTKDKLIYDYGIIKCGTEVFNSIDKSEIIAYRKQDYEWQVLVTDRKKAQQKYKKAVVDQVSIDEIMLLIVKGECVKLFSDSSISCNA